MVVVLLIFVIGVGASLRGSSCHPDAGRHDIATQSNVGIWGGHAITIEQVPYMASVRCSMGGSWMHRCGSSIIHEQFVLTAAHCILPNLKYKIIVGTDNLNGNGGEFIDIKQINIHPKYNSTTGDYDFCLIELERPVNFNSKVAKVNLSESDDELHEETKFNVTGWGLTEFGIQPRKLRQVEILSDNWAKCKAQYLRIASLHKVKYAITRRVICAGGSGRDACQGDSGGPLMLGEKQIGVTSWGFDCNVMPGVYAKISSVRAWIIEIIHHHS